MMQKSSGGRDGADPDGRHRQALCVFVEYSCRHLFIKISPSSVYFIIFQAQSAL